MTKIVGLLIGLLIFGFGLYYLIKEKVRSPCWYERQHWGYGHCSCFGKLLLLLQKQKIAERVWQTECVKETIRVKL